MKQSYPIILTPAQEGGYIVYIPDFNINTQGDDKHEAILMARDAIFTTACCLHDKNINLPMPSDIDNVTANSDEIKILIDVDFNMPNTEDSATA